MRKAPERRCELFRWVVAIPGAESLKNAPSAIVARYGGRSPASVACSKASTWSSFRLVIEAPDGVQVLREELLTEGR